MLGITQPLTGHTQQPSAAPVQAASAGHPTCQVGVAVEPQLVQFGEAPLRAPIHRQRADQVSICNAGPGQVDEGVCPAGRQLEGQDVAVQVQRVQAQGAQRIP